VSDLGFTRIALCLWQETQATAVWRPCRGKAVREWSIFVVRHPSVVWHAVHVAPKLGWWRSLWQLVHDENDNPLYVPFGWQPAHVTDL
jgi:hypothetical protein